MLSISLLISKLFYTKACMDRTFLGPKSLDFQGPPLPLALEMDFPPSKSFTPRHVNYRYTYIKGTVS